VPVAVNLYKVREDRGAAGALFRSVQQQTPQYQGIWIVSPDGKVLSAHHEIKSHATWSREVLDTIEAGEKAYYREGERPASRSVPPSPQRDASRSATPSPQPSPSEGRGSRSPGEGSGPLPHRGIGVLPDGGVCLAIYSRYVRGGGKERAPAAVNPESLWLWDGPVKPDGPPVIDSVTLTGAEWAQLAPKKASVGAEWAVSESLVRKLVRALSPSSDQSTMPRPEEATVAKLRARVDSVEGGRMRVALAGRLEAKHIYLEKASYAWAAAEGTIVFISGKPLSLLLGISGAYRMAPPYDTADRPVGAVIEWRRE
jgi:hypothetical protein